MAYKLTEKGLNKVKTAKATIPKPDHLYEEGNKKRLTNQNLADLAHVDESSVKRFFNLNTGVSQDYFIAILKALNLNITDLIEGEDYVNAHQISVEETRAKKLQENEQAEQQELIRKQQQIKGETTMVNATIETQITEVNVNNDNSELTFADFRQFLGNWAWGFFFDPKVQTDPEENDDWISEKMENGTYEIFKPEYQELFFLWLQQDDVSLTEKEEIFEKLIKFDDECDLFFEIKAHVIAAKSLKYFKTNSFWVNILIDRLVLWAFGDYEKEEKYWGYYEDHLEKGSREALLNTDPNLVIPKLENKLTEISNISDQVRGLNEIVDTIQKYLDYCKEEQESGTYLDHSLSDNQKQLLRDLYNKLSSKNDDNSAEEINLVEYILNLDFEELDESLKYDYVTTHCQVYHSENFAYYDIDLWDEGNIKDYRFHGLGCGPDQLFWNLMFLKELSFEDNTMQLFLEKLYLYDGEFSKPLANTLIEFIKSIIPETNDQKLINWIVYILNDVVNTLFYYEYAKYNSFYNDPAVDIASSHLIFLNQLSKQYPSISIEKIIVDFFDRLSLNCDISHPDLGHSYSDVLHEFFSSCECDISETFIKKLAKYYFEDFDDDDDECLDGHRDEVKIAIAERFTDYHEFYELIHNKEKSKTTTKSNFYRNIPEKINNYLKEDFSFIFDDFQFIYVNIDQIVNPENPALEIYLEMIKSGLPQAQESRPKTLSELKVYWELELKEIKPRPVLVLYTPTSNILPETVLSQLNRLNQPICLFSSEEPENCPLPHFKEELNEFLKWLLKVKHQVILN